MTEALLQIRSLSVQYADAARAARVHALEDVSLELAAGQSLGLVGESGSGKTQLLLSILGLLAPQAQISGSIRYDGGELLGLPAAALNRVRGRRIAMVFQDPMSALNPYLRIGDQISESARVHLALSRREAAERALCMLRAVQISEPERRSRAYPHELSGGMRQRVVLAMALISEPRIILADEPTTALDVTVQAQIIELLSELRARSGAALLLVTHDLGVIAQLTERTAVMYAGRVVEQASTTSLFEDPQHPYSAALLASLPRLDAPLQARLPTIEGQPPDPAHRPAGCAFAPRCAYRLALCEHSVPALSARGHGGAAACFYHGALARRDEIKRT